MKNLFITILIGLLLISCGKTVSSDVKFKRASLSGFVQKGPFINGTRVNLQELNQNFIQTGKVFSTEMTSNIGQFEIRNIELESSYALLSSNGFYFNEVKGEISEAPLTLNGLIDLSSANTVNLNILTHLMRPRIEQLLTEGKTFLNATQQARNELLAVFGFSLSSDETAESFDITQNVESAAILLAVSVIMQGNSGTGELSELLATFSENFRALGVITNPQILARLRSNALNLDYDTILENLITRYQELGEDVNIPNFQEQINVFLQTTGEPPKIQDVMIVNISSQSASITAMVNPNSLMTEVLLLFGTSEVLLDSLVIPNTPISGEGFQKVEASLVELSKNTNYYFKILARNAEGEVLSEIYTLKTLDNFDLIIEVLGEGEVEITVIQAKMSSHDEGTNLELRALPAQNWVFYRWGGDLNTNHNPTTIEVNESKTVISEFKSINELLQVEIVGEGSVEVQQAPFENNLSGRVVSITPIPSNGWTFLEWSGDLSGSQVPVQLTLEESIFVRATFTPAVYLSDNGITIMCPNGNVGAIGVVNGIEYEVVDRNLLIQRRDEGKDLSKVCVSRVTDMSSLFSERPFNDPIGSWDVSSVTDMSYMFLGTPFNQPIGNWDVSSVTDMGYMFDNSRFNQSISNWSVSNVKDMRRMFSETPFNQPIGDWDVSSVRTMNGMFNNASSFNQPIGDWNVRNVTDMYAMFSKSPFNQLIGNWDVTSVEDMAYMFFLTEFNQNIANWNVSNVKDLTGMFQNNEKINQDLSTWCVWRFPEKPDSFDENTPQWTLPKPIWGTCPTP